MKPYKRVAVKDVKPRDHVITETGDLLQVTAVDVAQDAVCLHGRCFGDGGFNILLCTFTAVHEETVIRIHEAGT